MKAEEAYNYLEKVINESKEDVLKDGTRIFSDKNAWGKMDFNERFKAVIEEYLTYKKMYFDSEIKDSDKDFQKYNKKAFELICDSVKELIK